MTVPHPTRRSPITRRRVLQGAAVAAGTAAMPMLARAQSGTPSDTLRIGFVSPRSGPLALFGEGDGYVLDLVRRHTAAGVPAGGKAVKLEFIAKDTQSNPVRAAAVAKELINADKVDFVLSTSTPETVNPVADACEAAGVPALSTTSPWEAFYFGRGAKPGEPSPFKWTYHFCFGVGNFAKLYTDQWSKVATNRKVGMLLPADADGNAIRGLLMPALHKAGFTVFDAGPYQNGMTDFSAQIAAFKKEGIEIFNTFPFPPDFAVFWRQAAQRGLAQQTKIVQMAKAGLFAVELEALGQLGHGLHAGAYWHKSFPFNSPATGLSCAQLAEGYEKASGKPWQQQLGATASLFDAALAAVRGAVNPKDRAALAASMARLKTETAVGDIDFTSGPVPNCAPTGLVGVQWLRGKGGGNKFGIEIVSNADHPKVPVTAQMTAYSLKA
ncbi:MAG: ABC transporter substrate-binding protein [Burkholderiales bacterium]|nr:ABC transporter substrate-binding protein [Burkholderiales bacterium]